MNDDPMLARLDRLERRNRRLLAWLVVMTIGLVVLGSALGLVVTSLPFAIVRNPFGGPRIAMMAFGNTSTLSFWNDGPNSRLQLGTSPKGAMVSVLGREGKSRMTLMTSEKDGKDLPVLMLYDATNPQGAFQVDLLNGGSPQLVMKSPVGKGRVELKFLPDGDPVLRLVGKDGTVVFQTPVPEVPVTPPVEPAKGTVDGLR